MTSDLPRAQGGPIYLRPHSTPVLNASQGGVSMAFVEPANSFLPPPPSSTTPPGSIAVIGTYSAPAVHGRRLCLGSVLPACPTT